MNIRIALLTTACALALSACGEKSPPPAASASPATESPSVAASDAPEQGGSVAAVAGCETEIEGNDAMQYNIKSISVPASCTDFTITLRHTGKMPVAAMGHNVVISASKDMQGVVAAGMTAGLAADYVKPGADDVIAYSKMIGGGETTSVTFAVSKIRDGGPYKFFCSFPGHASLMNGTITVE